MSDTSLADEASLRASPSTYPQYIRDRDLPLPSTVPSRVQELAVRITANATNNYDKARAIELYLRAKIKYDESIAPPPPDVDAVDYTLFDRPAGYCNYYASAMAVLAREIGIPARVVSGYAMGDAVQGVFHVTEGNAHSWPELYFGNLGWIGFEPTSSKPEIIRPAKPAPVDTSADQTSDLPREIPRSPQNLGNPGTGSQTGANWFLLPIPSGPVGVVVGAGSGSLLLILFAIGVGQLIWTQRMRLLSPAGRAWEEMYRFARWAGFQEQAQATPIERAEELARVMPDARPLIASVTDLYMRERYGRQTLSPEEESRAEQARGLLGKRVLRGAVENILEKGPLQLYRSTRGKIDQLRKRSYTGDKPNA